MRTNPGTPTSPPVRQQIVRPFIIKWDRIAGYLVLAIFTVIYLGPLLMLINTSLNTTAGFMRDATAPTTILNFKNFVMAWQKANFPKYLLNSLLYTTASTFIYVVTAVFVAFPLARGYVKGHNFLFTLYVIALFLPSSLIPLFQLMLNLHLYNTQPGYIFLFLVDPIGILILVNYIKTLPKEMDEAAALDGCGYLRFVIQIVIPLIQPAIATITVLRAISIWNELVLPTIYLSNKDYYPVTRALIVFQGVYGNDWPVLAAAILILTMPMVVLYMFLQRFIISGITAGSMR